VFHAEYQAFASEPGRAAITFMQVVAEFIIEKHFR
jgi:hypothetical protein